MTTLTPKPNAATARLRVQVRGAVQGVGFRPFVYRLATELGLGGWVNNSGAGVWIEVEGRVAELETFLCRLAIDPPPRSSIQSSEAIWLDALGYEGFEIRASDPAGDKSAWVLPDIATCPDCLREMFDPGNRRYRYPFTNCTNCGPRFSIIEALPYDRSNTSMRRFRMCPDCQAEYDNPEDRRFHAQPNACPVCGPQLELWPGGTSPHSRDAGPPRPLAAGNDALLAAAHVIRCGQIVAVKGVGGFHLLVDARNEEAVRWLRERKEREAKPFALMFPSLASVKGICKVSPLEERLLQSPEAPIVLLRTRPPSPLHPAPALSRDIAPNNPHLGVMLPSNPVQHLLLAELGFPVVATSGNLSDEPICTDELEALERLRGIADVFLVNNRPIVRHADDSMVRVMLDREMVLRRARGYAPLPIALNSGYADAEAKIVLGLGAHLKNSVALAVGGQVFLSQHIGDLETEAANQAFRRVAADLPRLYAAPPELVAADLHPDYLSTRYAAEIGRAGSSRSADAPQPVPGMISVQHHMAHALACLAENEVELPALGVAWDGTGLGTDGSIWGGEFFLVTEESIERVAHLRPFPLPGGAVAVKEPRRAALGILHEMQVATVGTAAGATFAACSTVELAALQTMLDRGINAPQCSSVGRLFDAVASLTGLCQQMRFEGQAAMELEFALEGCVTDESYPIPLVVGDGAGLLDWAPMISAILADLKLGCGLGEISARFHNALAEAIVTVARQVGQPRVALSGGCFQNRYLTERAVRRLRAAGFQPYWHQRVPTNDGGIALGQVVAARREIAAGKSGGAAPRCRITAQPLHDLCV